jgi:hypothetical protein
MTAPRDRDPTRWRARDANSAAPVGEAQAARLADAAAQVPPLGPPGLARIRNAVLARRSDRHPFRYFFHRGWVSGGLSTRARFAVGLGLVLVCVTTAGGATLLWHKYLRVAQRAAPSPSGPRRAIPPRAFRASSGVDHSGAVWPPNQASEASPTQAVPPPESPRPTAPVGDHPRPAVARVASSDRSAPAVAEPARPEIPAPAPLPAPSPVEMPAPTPRDTEAGLVAQALSEPRQRDDPRAASATLERYAQEFPHGVLETEAQRTRVEAAIQLQDLKTALTLLESRPGASDWLGVDLLLTRAELRAAAGHFAEALLDFNRVLESAEGPLASGGDERALYGRAVCLGRLGQDDRARIDLLAYQRRFPSGRFTGEVQRLLAGSVPLKRQ